MRIIRFKQNINPNSGKHARLSQEHDQSAAVTKDTSPAAQGSPHPARADPQQQPDGSKAKAASEHTPLKKKKSQKQKATPRDTPIKRDALLEQAKAKLQKKKKKKKQRKKSKEQRDTPPKDTPNKSQAPEDNAEPATNSQLASPEEAMGEKSKGPRDTPLQDTPNETQAATEEEKQPATTTTEETAAGDTPQEGTPNPLSAAIRCTGPVRQPRPNRPATWDGLARARPQVFDLLGEEEASEDPEIQEKAQDPDYADEVWGDNDDDNSDDLSEAAAEEQQQEQPEAPGQDPTPSSPRRLRRKGPGRPRLATKGRVERDPHSSVRAFVCPECDTVFKHRLDSLKRHLKLIHKAKPGDATFKKIADVGWPEGTLQVVQEALWQPVPTQAALQGGQEEREDMEKKKAAYEKSAAETAGCI